MIRSYSTLLSWLGFTIIASLMLYHTSDRVNALDRQLRELNAQIAAEQQSLHVLKAEWVYLANPTRVEAEAQRHLGLQPTAPRRVAALQNIGDLLPLRGGVDAAPQVQTAQAAAFQAEAPLPTPGVKQSRMIAALTAEHVNERMAMPHKAASEASTDKIGALIGAMGLHP